MPMLTINGTLHGYDEAGNGEPLLLVHAGIADRRMWDDVWPTLTARHRVIRFDLRGYGETPLPDGRFTYAADAEALLAARGVERAHVVGISMGGGVALDLALAHPERVERLVLVAPVLPGWEWGAAMNAFDAAETAALERGDVAEASWVNVRFWVDGPRPPDVVDPALRRRVFEMQRRAFEADNPNAEAGWLIPNRRDRLGEVRAPTLIIVGELDQPDVAEMGNLMADAIPDARLVSMAGVAHLPPMEAPEDFARMVLRFLAG